MHIRCCAPLSINNTVRKEYRGRKLVRLDWFDHISGLLMLLSRWYVSFHLGVDVIPITDTRCAASLVLIIMNGKNVFHPGGGLSLDTVVSIYKFGYVMMPQSTLNQTFTKLSVLFLYHRIFFINRTFVMWIYSVGSILVAWCIVTVFIGLFVCKPIAAAYDPRIKGECLDSQALLAAGVFNSALDFIMVGMAVWMVVGLKLPTATRLKLGVLFALGGLSGVIGIVKVASAYGTVGKR